MISAPQADQSSDLFTNCCIIVELEFLHLIFSAFLANGQCPLPYSGSDAVTSLTQAPLTYEDILLEAKPSFSWSGLCQFEVLTAGCGPTKQRQAAGMYPTARDS